MIYRGQSRCVYNFLSNNSEKKMYVHVMRMQMWQHANNWWIWVQFLQLFSKFAIISKVSFKSK